MMIVRLLRIYKKLVIIIVFFLFFLFLASRGIIFSPHEREYGVTFSHKQARDLGLDWQQTYLSMLDELGVRKLRLAAYWDEIERDKDNYDFWYLDYQIEEASKRNAELVLAIGARVPRWPECHFPAWAKEIAKEEREKELLAYMQAVIERYRDKPAIRYWQIENEAFLPGFGECPPLDKEFLDREIALARSLDSRPIMLTDSGELSLWVPAAKRADVFGTTMYLDTYSAKLESYIRYPIEPGFFRFKRNISRLFANPDKWVVIELQAEPWGPIPFQFLSPEERSRTMDLEKFRRIIEFSGETGFREFYLWGVEWWYWEKEKNGNPGLWDEARTLFN